MDKENNINREQPMADGIRKEQARVHYKRNIGPDDPEHFSNYEIDPKTGKPDPDHPKTGGLD